MNTAEALVKILENNNVKYIFGHPGEQIISMYAALKDSLIEHVFGGVNPQGCEVHSFKIFGQRTKGEFAL